MPMMLPTQTPVPRPTPTALPATTIDDTPSSVLAHEAFAFLETFTNVHSPRASATDQELVAARALMGHLEEMGYQTFLQDFTVDRLESEISVSSNTSAVPDNVGSLPITLSYAGVAGGLIADAGMALPQDIPAIGLDGKVALIERGTITFEEKVRRVTEAGAIAAVIFNNKAGLFRGTSLDSIDNPRVGDRPHDRSRAAWSDGTCRRGSHRRRLKRQYPVSKRGG